MAETVLAKLAIQIIAQTSQFASGINDANKKLDGFSKGVKNAGAAIGLAFGAREIYNGLAYGVGIISDFEKQMSEVRAIVGGSTKDFKELSDSALKLGKSTLYTAKQVGELQVAYGRLGFTKNEIIAATKATLDLATATGEDLAKSADVAGSTIRAFGKAASDTQNVTDVMAASFNQTALGLENFSEAMKYVAPVANANNISLERTTALLGVLADAGIRGSSAGTALRKIISDLKGETGTFNEKLQKLADKGLSAKDAMDEVGRTGYAALLVISKNIDKADALTESFKNVTGATAEMARVMSDNLAGDATKAGTALDGLILKLSGASSWLRNVTQQWRFFIGGLSGDKFIELEEYIDRLAETIQRDGRLMEGEVSSFIESARKLRKETGAPIDLSIIKSLTDKYKLTEDQANKLYQSVVKINKEFGNDETIISNFDLFRKGYKDAITAADEFVKIQNKEIVNLQIKRDQQRKLAEFQKGDTGSVSSEFQKEIDATSKIIDYRFKSIQVVNDYVKSLTKIAPLTQSEIDALAEIAIALEKEKAIQKEINDLRNKRLVRGAKVLLDFSSTDLVSLISKYAKEFSDAVKKHEDDFKLIVLVDTTQLEKLPSKITDIGASLKESVKSATNGLKQTAQEISDTMVDISGQVANGIANLADALGTAIATGDFDNFGRAILEAVANFSQQLGAMLIAQGVAIKAFEFGDATTKIIAGVALVAAGAAIKGLIKNPPKVSGGGGSGRGTAARYDNASGSNAIIFNGEFRVSGNDLVAVINNTNTKNSRING